VFKKFLLSAGILFFTLTASLVYSGYHHMGEKDLSQFLKVYPDKKNTKLDSCALCHTGGQYFKKSGVSMSLGSCQWCHYKYGYDESGNITDTLNPYGKDYLSHGRNENAITFIKLKDSDGDTYTNQTEIESVRFPGNREDDINKKIAPFREYTQKQLKSLPRHTQFLLMNSNKSGDFYAEYKGVTLEVLLRDVGISEDATGIYVYSPDGWSQYHPFEYDPDPSLYHVFGTYPSAVYQYNIQADKAHGGWCDYSSPSCTGRNHNDRITVPGGLKVLLAYERDGGELHPGVLNINNKLDGAGPYRIIVPQKNPGPPDQSSNASNKDVIWPYRSNWDHNTGASSRSVAIIKVVPLPEGTTDIDLLETGWSSVEQGKIIIYGALKR